MRWIRGMDRAGRQDARAGRLHDTRQDAGATLSNKRVLGRFMVVILTVGALLLSGAPSEKQLAVYSLAANYSLPLVQREGREYVGLLELLEPLGKVSAKSDGSRWRLRYNNAEGIFQAGKTRARVQDRDADLGGKFFMENKRGLVPVGSLSSLLPRFLGGPVSLHEESNRLFIGSVATHFTASLAGDNPPKLVFHFTSPVNPSIATEPGSLRMTFSREPLVGPASTTLTFGSKAIPSASYSEGNGSAVVTVNSTVPVMATFGNDGRTITVAPAAASAAAQTAAPAATPAPGTPATPGQAASTPPVPTPAPRETRAPSRNPGPGTPSPAGPSRQHSTGPNAAAAGSGGAPLFCGSRCQP